MVHRNITLRVDSELYSRYRSLCKNEGLFASRRFELFMQKEINDNEKQKKLGEN